MGKQLADTGKGVSEEVSSFDFKLILIYLYTLDLSISMMTPTLSTYTPEGRQYCIALPASLQSNPPSLPTLGLLWWRRRKRSSLVPQLEGSLTMERRQTS